MKGLMKRFVFGALALAASLALVATDVDARAGRGGSSGSRGVNTQSAPPTTNTAPRSANPIDKSITQPGKAGATAAAAGAAGKAGAVAGAASRFGGLKGILLGGLIGAALASFLGPGMLASMLGGLLWFGLLAGLAMLVVGFIRNRMGGTPALAQAQAGAGPGQSQPQNAAYRTAVGGGLGGSAPALEIGQADFNSFERLLGDVQNAYGRGDIDALGSRTTPEMLSYFANDLEDDRRKGLKNEVFGAKLLQGDLAESWREPGSEFATVAMRYSLTDATVEVASGKVVSGSRTAPQEVTEIWTFRRPVNGTDAQWELSAIQQTA